MSSQLEPLLAGIVRDYGIVPPKYALIGESFGAARHWAFGHQLSLSRFGYVASLHDLAGVAPPWEVVITGWPHAMRKQELLLDSLRVLEASGVKIHWTGDIDT